MSSHTSISSYWFATVSLGWFISLVILITANSAQGQSAIKISQIEIEGLKQLKPAEVITATGLKIGQPFDIETVDQATQRLADSGLFKKLQYRIRTNGNAATIVFVVEESTAGSSRVVFDNFIWFSDEQLYEAVKREVPSFTGTAPDAGETLNNIAGALKKLLKEHQIEAAVEHMAYQSGKTQEQVFSVTGITLPICALHFPGSSNVSESKLIAGAKEIIGTDFSRKIVSSFAIVRLFPLYREVGQLKARFHTPVGKPGDNGKCSKGVDLTVPVEEGLIYNWDKAAWSGNQVYSAQELDSILGMKKGEVANGLKFDKGVEAIGDAYGRKGYLEARVGPKPEFDDAGNQVSYNLAVVEGPQYRMGTLTITGLTEIHEKRVRTKWPLRTGDVFDQSVVKGSQNKPMDEVMSTIIRDYLALGTTPPTHVDISLKPDRTTLTVAVTIKLGFQGVK